MKTREAFYYKYQNDNTARCFLCPHNCLLKEDELSICKSRILKNDKKVHALSYGNILAQNIDPVEKKPLYHFLPGSLTYSIGTPGCNLFCKNCQNSDISQAENNPEPESLITPEQIIRYTKRKNIKSVSYTYTEPAIFYEMMYETSVVAKENGVKNIMVTNGYINNKPLKDISGYIDAANIDMKAFNDDVYKYLTGGSLSPVLNTIKKLKEAGTHIEITLLLIPGLSDKEEDINGFLEWINKNELTEVPLHISRFFPTYKLLSRGITTAEDMINLRKKAFDKGLKHVYLGNIDINGSSDTYCPNCGKIVVKRSQYMVNSYLSDNAYCPSCNYKIL